MTRRRSGRPKTAVPGEGLLAGAIERRDWDAAALCLLWGVARAARTLPPGGIEALLQLLTSPARRRGTRRPRTGGETGHGQGS